MRKILIITHGRFASGVKDTLSILYGNVNNIMSIDAYTQGVDIDKEVDAFFEKIEPNDEIVVFTDIPGGSVNQKMLTYLNKKNMYLISGFNLAILLEVLFQKENLTVDLIDELVEQNRKALLQIKKENLQDNCQELFFD